MGDRQAPAQDQTSPAPAAEPDTLEFSQIIRPHPGLDLPEVESAATGAPGVAPRYGRRPDAEVPSAAVAYAARIAVVVGVSLVLGPMGYTAGLILRDRPAHQGRQQTAHAVTVHVAQGPSVTVVRPDVPASPPPPTTALVEMPGPTAVAAAPSDSVLASVPAAPTEASDDTCDPASATGSLEVSGVDAVSQASSNPGVDSPSATTEAEPPPRATSGPSASTRELPRHPSIAAFLQAQSTLAKRFATCNVHLGHHAYVHVRYDGATGQPGRVEFVGHTLDGNPLTACLESEVRAVNLTPFRDAQWEAHYIVMIR